MNSLKVFILILLATSCLTAFSDANNFAPSTEMWKPDLFLEIYYNGVSMISFEIGKDYSTLSKEDMQKIFDDISKNACIVKEIDLSKYEPPAELFDRFDHYIVAELYNYLKQRELCPLKTEKEEYYKNHLKDFQEPDTFEGARFLIEEGLDLKEQAKIWKEKLDNSKKTFREVAKEYYQTVGEDKDGYIGEIERGTIREDLFDIFFKADPNAPYFGPVETKNGMLFGKVYRKHPAGPQPFEEVEWQVERDIVKERLNKFYNDFFAKEKPKHKLEILFDKSASEAPNLDTVVYRVDGEDITYSKVVQCHPNMFGDVKLIDFLVDMVEKDSKDRILYNSDEGRKTKESPEYKFFRNAFVNQYKVYNLLKEEYDKITKTENDFLNFYEQYKDELYKVSANVKLISVIILRNPYGIKSPKGYHTESKRAWENINKIRNDFMNFIKSADPERFSFESYKDIDGLDTEIFKEMRASDTLSPIITEDIGNHTPGYTSSILIGKREYAFYHILDRREGSYKSFKDIQEKVKNDYIEFKKKEIRKKFKIE